MARFTLVIPEVRWNPDTRKDDVRPHYIGCVAVGNMALQVMVESMKSGEKIYVLGHLDQAEIPTGDGGKDRKTRVRVDLFHRLQGPPRVPDL